jgi:hypothetical protein
MRTAFVIGAVVALSLSGFAFYQWSTASMNMELQKGTYSGPANATPAQIRAANVAIATGQPLPAGWHLIHDEGTVKVVDTGVKIPQTGERAWTVTVLAPRTDLVSATAYVNSQPVYTATRANHGITDRGNMSIATLPVLVPPATQTWTGKVEWVADDSTIRDTSILLP